MRRALFAVIAVVAVGAALIPATPALAGGGCHDEATESNASMVELRNLCFTSTVTHVDPGQEVAFVNRDSYRHNVVGLGLWGDVEGLRYGETRRFTFEEPGVYPYACTLHTGMVGAIVVGGDERHAGDAGTVAAVSGSVTGGPGGATSAGSRESTPVGSWLPEVAVTLALAALVLGAGLLLRRRSESPTFDI